MALISVLARALLIVTTVALVVYWPLPFWVAVFLVVTSVLAVIAMSRLRPETWLDRVQVDCETDWARYGSGAWDIDLLSLHVHRNHERGVLAVWGGLLGFHVRLGILISLHEGFLYLARQEATREAYLASLPVELRDGVREMIKDVPLDATIEVRHATVQEGEFANDEQQEKPHVTGRRGYTKMRGVH